MGGDGAGREHPAASDRRRHRRDLDRSGTGGDPLLGRQRHRGCAAPQRSIKRIRRYYLELHPDAAEFFGDAADGPGRRAPAVPGGLGGVAGQVMYHSWVQLLFTAASMVAAINSILGGAGVALLLRRLALVGEGPAAVVGVVAAVVLFAIHVWSERHRFSRLVDRPAVADQSSASTSGFRR